MENKELCKDCPKDIEKSDPVLRSFFYGIGKMTVIMPSAFLSSMGIALATLGLIYFLKAKYNVDVQVVGFFGALWSISYFSGCILLRPLGRHFIPRWSMLSATVLMMIFLILIIVVDGIVPAFIFYGLFGMSSALFWPPIMSWLTSGVEGPALSKASSKFSMSWSLGGTIAPAITGILAEINPIYPAYGGILAFGACSLYVLVASLILPNIKIDTHTSSGPSEESKIDSSTRIRYASWIGVFIVYLFMGVFFNILPLFALDYFHLSKSQTGLIFFIRAFVTMGTFILLGRIHFWQFNKKLILLAQGFFAILLLVMTIGMNIYVWIPCIFIIGFLLAYMYNNSMFHGVSGAVERSKRVSIHEAVLTFGQIVGSALGGFIYQNFNMQTVLLTIFGITIIGMFAQKYFLQSSEKPLKKEAKPS